MSKASLNFLYFNMNTEEQFNPQQSLQVIESMINKAKDKFNENGYLYLLWGWVIFFCSLFHFICLKFKLLAQPELVWIATWLAVIYQVIYLSKKRKKQTVKTYTDEVRKYVWISFAIMLLLVVFLLNIKEAWENMYPMFLVLYGMPTFLSGVIFRFTPLKIGGIICWGLSVAAGFISWEYQLLLLALAVVSAWIIPGYLLREKFKKSS